MKEQYGFVFFLVLSMVLLVCHFLLGGLFDYKPVMTNGKGIIEGINRNDNGRKWFYIRIETPNGSELANTDNYRTVPEGTDVGDEVEVKYYYTKKGVLRCRVTESGFESVAGEDEGNSPYLLYAAGVSFAAFAMLLIKYIASK